MNWQKAYQLLNSVGSDVFTAGTQWMSNAGWLNTPDLTIRELGQGDFHYIVNRNWCQANPAEYPIKNCHEMVIDSKHRLFLLTDHPQNNMLVFDLDGKLLDSWTLAFKSAHGLTLAREADEEFLWICDPYSATVVKTTLQGQVVQRLPDAHALGIYAPSMPYLPTQTAVAPNGDIYVADGYGSSCILQFDAAGNFIRFFGGKGKQPGNLDFSHGIAIDDRKGTGQEIFLVSSRKQSCIKQFNLDGVYLGTIELPGGFPCRPVIYKDCLLIGLCWSGTHLKPNTGFVIVLDSSNRVCATLGGTAVFADTGKLLSLRSDYSCFNHVHDVCADPYGNLYVCQWNAGAVYPFQLKKTPKTGPTG